MKPRKHRYQNDSYCIGHLGTRLAALESVVGQMGPALSVSPVERVMAEGWERLKVHGWRLGTSWVCTHRDRKDMCCCAPANYGKTPSIGACEAHAVEMGVFAPVPAAPAVEPQRKPVDWWLRINVGVWVRCSLCENRGSYLLSVGPTFRASCEACAVEAGVFGPINRNAQPSVEPAPAEKPGPVPGCDDSCGMMGEGFCSEACREAGRPLNPAVISKTETAADAPARAAGVFAPVVAEPAKVEAPLRACTTVACASARDHEGPCRRIDGSLIDGQAGEPKVEAPRCEPGCGGDVTLEWTCGGREYCSRECSEAMCPLNPPPGPVSGADGATEPRVPGCQCHWEVGDSPCRVHGEEEPSPQPDAPARDGEAVSHMDARHHVLPPGVNLDDPHVEALCRYIDQRKAMEESLRAELAEARARIVELWPAQPAQSPAPTGCVCKEPGTPGVVHRTDGPCYMAPAPTGNREAAEVFFKQLALPDVAPADVDELGREFDRRDRAAEQRGAAKALDRIDGLLTEAWVSIGDVRTDAQPSRGEASAVVNVRECLKAARALIDKAKGRAALSGDAK